MVGSPGPPVIVVSLPVGMIDGIMLSKFTGGTSVDGAEGVDGNGGVTAAVGSSAAGTMGSLVAAGISVCGSSWPLGTGLGVVGNGAPGKFVFVLLSMSAS